MSFHDLYPAYGGRGPTCVAIGLSLGIVATLLIILRVYVRLRINKIGTTALIWAVAAWTLTVITQVFGVLAALHGLGNHITVLVENETTHYFLKFTWFTVFFFVIAIATGKVAVAAFLLEINGTAHPKIRWALIAIAAANYTISIPVAIYSQLHCSPYDALWDPLRQTQCNAYAYTILSYLIGGVAAMSDFALALIPTYILWSLQIDKKLKWGLCVLLGLGMLAAVAAIVRAWASSFLQSPDSSWYLGILFTWGEVEEWVLIICMTIPPTWPVFKPYVQRFLAITQNGTRWTLQRQHQDKASVGSSRDGFEMAAPHRSRRDAKAGYVEVDEDKDRLVRSIGHG